METPTGPGYRILADIGGTNARFARQYPGEAPGNIVVFRTRDFPDPGAAAAAYLQRIGEDRPPLAAAFAVACPVSGDWIELTNHPWSFSVAALQRSMEVEVLRVINDFTAVALAAPHLNLEDVEAIGGGTAVPGEAIAIIGPGTGLGVSALVPAGEGRMVPVENEGGHVTCAAADERESAVVGLLRKTYGHVSAERCLSGPGLVNLYRALAELEGRVPEPLEPKEVTGNAASGVCDLCVSAVEMFCAMLGTAASNLALTLGSRGGVYLAGGIVPKLGRVFVDSRFRERFEDKGRFSDYLQATPTQVITHPTPALLGLGTLFNQSS